MIPDLFKIRDWLKANRLSLNTLGTELMLIGTNWNLSKIADLLALTINSDLIRISSDLIRISSDLIRISSDLIRRAHKAKYLSLVMDEKLSWKEHIYRLYFN